METLFSFKEALNRMPPPAKVELQEVVDTEATDVEAVGQGIGAEAVKQEVIF